MAEVTWVALLRGVNVGGRHRLPMADLRSGLTDAGLHDVRTYIQSGNVVFDAAESTDESGWAELVGDVIETQAGFRVPVIVRRLDEIVSVAAEHPDEGSAVPAKWLHVVLLDGHADPARAPDPERFGPDRVAVDGRQLYLTYPSGVGRSKLTIDVLERAFGVTGTARNLSTLAAIASLGSDR